MKKRVSQEKLNSVLRRESACGNTEAVKAVLDAGADVHAFDDFALRVASSGGYTDTVDGAAR